MKNTVSVRLVSRIIAFALIAVLQVPYALIYNQAHAQDGETTSSSSSTTEMQSETTDPITPVDPTIVPPDPTTEAVVEPEPVVEAEPLDLPPEPEPVMVADAAPEPLPQREDKSKTQVKPEIDQTTGALSYSYPFDVPEGRNKLTPIISLSYNSQETSNDSIAGYGWSLSVPSIKRVNKNGVDKLYDAQTETFVSSLDGELVLVDPVLHTYRPVVDTGAFHIYTYMNNSWTVTDKSGDTYVFGASAQSRQDDSIDPSRVYAWNVETITDTNLNAITYTYTKDHGQIYPETISYAPFLIEFELENYTHATTMYDAGFPLKTNYRIASVGVKIDNQLTKKYAFAYTVGDAGYRSLLESVTENGYTPPSLVPTTLPPTVFTYKGRGTLGWTNGPGWELPIDYSYNGKSRLVQIKDINGDAYPDILYLTNEQPGLNAPCQYRQIYLNNADGTFALQNCQTEWATPFSLKDYNYTSRDGGYRLFDYNGDKISDSIQIVESGNNDPNQINGFKGTGISQNAWVNTNVSSPVGFTFNLNGHYDNGTQIIDANADGIPDIVRGWLDDDIGNVLTLEENSYIGDGAGVWTETNPGEWELPWGIIDENFAGPEMPTNAQFTDVNGDGLVDYAFRKSNDTIIGINNGKTWTNPNVCVSFPIPTQASTYAVQAQSDTGVRMIDINGDGISDVIQAFKFAGNNYVSTDIILNSLDETTCLFQNAAIINPVIVSPLEFASHGNDTNVISISDINADGMEDLIRADEDPNPNPNVFDYQTHLANGTPYTDKLISITTPTNLHTDISYKPSTQYKDGNGALLNPHLPIIVDTVESITTTDPLDASSVRTDYAYSNGEYFYVGPHDKKFTGFEKVEENIYDNVTNTLLKKNVSYFHQGDLNNTLPDTNPSLSALGEQPDTRSKIGLVFRTETYDGDGNILEKQITRFAETQIAPGSVFVYRTMALSQTYDGATHVDTGYTYAYNTTTGNLTAENDFGQVTGSNDGNFTDTGTDRKNTTTTYLVSANGKIHVPRTINVKNQAGAIEKETKHFYDNFANGVTLGNLTKVDVWKSGLGVGAAYVSTLYTHNANGLVLTETDPNGNVTTYAYGANNLYPTTVTQPLGLITSYVYDNTLGKPTQITDPNGRVFKYTYDVFGRILVEQIPYDSVPNTQITKTTYTYDDTPAPSAPVYVLKSTTNPTNNIYTLYNGFGQAIRTLTQTGGAVYVATDTTYDALGRVKTTSLPYVFNTTPTTYTGVLAPANLKTTFTYDGHDRPLTSVDVLGTTTTAYSGLVKTVTDANGKQKKYTTNVRGQLTKVEEKIGATWYPTVYTYNTQGDLTQITDALGNVRNFTYDGRGVRLTATDLHAPADVTFGTYTYNYDNNGAVISKVTPLGDTIVYTYDALGRILTEKLSTDPSPRTTYTYDACLDGKTRLCTVTQSNGASVAYTYTANGQAKTEVVTLPGGGPYTFSYGYNYQQNRTRTTYPDLTQIVTTYSYRNLPTQVQYQASGVNTNLATAVTYNPLGQVATMNRTNGLTTTNTYNANAQYRLTNRVSQKTGQSKLQDLAYTYDAVGNILTLVDNSVSATKKTATYTYDDLYRLTSAAITNVAAGQSPYTQTFTYNILGNITSKDGVAYTYTTPNKVNPHAPTAIGGQALSYNDNGNLLTDGVHTNVWNYKNELTTSTSGGATATYTYNHDGMRVKKQTPSTQIYSPTSFYSEENTKKTKTISLGDMLLGNIETTTMGGVTTHAPRYALVDHLGGTEKTVDANAAIVSTLDYYPYGHHRIDTGGTPERTYIGEKYDPESGYNYLNARYTDNGRGQFLSQDPVFWEIGQSNDGKSVLLNPQAQNTYSYGLNNPITQKDPSGRIVPYLIAALANILFLPNTAGETVNDDGSVTNSQGMTPTQQLTSTALLEAGGVVTGKAVGAILSKGSVQVSKATVEPNLNTAEKVVEHARQAAEYGQAGVKTLENGRVRYYSEIRPAKTPGEMQGLRKVREWNPETGAKRTWLETIDQQGNVRQVRPQENSSVKTHFIFRKDGKYSGKR